MRATQKTNRFSRTSECRIALRIKKSQSHILLAVALAALGACGPLAEVSKTEPKLGAQYGTIVELRRAEQAIDDAEKLKRTDPNRAVGFYLCGLEEAAKELWKNRRDRLALRDYNFALSRVFSILRDAHLDPWTRPLHVPAPDGGEYVLTQRPAANRLWKPQEFDLIPADELNVRGKFVVPRVTRQGIGASLVAVRNQQAPRIRQRFVPPRIYLAVTAVAHLSGRKYEIEFIDPLSMETATLSGRSLPSGADFTAPLALGCPANDLRRSVCRRCSTRRDSPARPASRKSNRTIQKIPVLFVHGLQSTPVTWVPLVNTIWADPILRRNYQVWVFSYPSGYPIPYSALLLRRELDALNKTFPNHRQIILVGHSMGGISAL